MKTLKVWSVCNLFGIWQLEKTRITERVDKKELNAFSRTMIYVEYGKMRDWGGAKR